MSHFLIGIKFKESKKVVSLRSLDYTLSLETVVRDTTYPDNMLSLLPAHSVHSTVETQEDTILESSDIIDNEYEIYSKIENHMFISIRLYFLNIQGQELLKQLGTKKLKLHEYSIPISLQHSIKNKTKYVISKSLSNIVSIYEPLHDIINFNRLHYNVYTELLNVLDEILFMDSKSIDIFYVKEDVFTLESLYYKQESWINELEDKNVDTYIFTDEPFLSLGECSDIMVYIQSYLKILEYLRQQYKNTKNQKLTNIVNKMEIKIKTVQNMCNDILTDELKKI